MNFPLLQQAFRQELAITSRIAQLICATGVAWLSTVPAGAAALPKKVTFEEHIRPILKAHCFECHGENEKPKAGLDLRLRRLMLQGGESGPAIQPGSAAKSHLLKLVREGEMPPRDKKLTRDEIAIIEKWISTGAMLARAEPQDPGKGSGITPEERQFWSFQPVTHPSVPKTRAKDRVRTPVDAFLVAAMSKQGLAFSPDADKPTLLRRAHLDLLGLPPTPEEAAQFLADNSPDAYERLIDRLLASPHYGERWGRHWLDVAGYADSDGYTEADTIRNYAYKYRDYVIRSFNADKPFNQFIQEQLAGDELATGTYPNRSPEQLDKLIATGFLRMPADGTATGGIDQNVARNQVMSDTIKVVSTSLLGLSVGCAQCHDHRYDPILQKDYYHLRAILEPAYDWQKWRTPPQRLISLYTEAHARGNQAA
jgi:mono/diheme cytochrome c family protein